MMTTLLKHEWLSSRGLLGAVMGAAALAALAGTLFTATGWPVVSEIGTLIALLAIASPIPVLQFLLAVLYWRSSYSKTGYFTHSLPLRGATIFAAKLLWAVVVSLAGFLLTLVLGMIFWPAAAPALGAERNPFVVLGEMWSMLNDLASPQVLIAGLIVVLGLLLLTPVQLFFAASIGAESPLNRFGLAGPLLVYVGLYVVFQVTFFIGLLVVPWGIGSVDGQLSTVSFNLIHEMRQGAESNTDVMPLGFVPVLFLVSLVCLWRTVISWNRKISLV